jgi:hypothetical protein
VHLAFSSRICEPSSMKVWLSKAYRNALIRCSL